MLRVVYSFVGVALLLVIALTGCDSENIVIGSGDMMAPTEVGAYIDTVRGFDKLVFFAIVDEYTTGLLLFGESDSLDYERIDGESDLFDRDDNIYSPTETFCKFYIDAESTSRKYFLVADGPSGQSETSDTIFVQPELHQNNSFNINFPEQSSTDVQIVTNVNWNPVLFANNYLVIANSLEFGSTLRWDIFLEEGRTSYSFGSYLYALWAKTPSDTLPGFTHIGLKVVAFDENHYGRVVSVPIDFTTGNEFSIPDATVLLPPENITPSSMTISWERSEIADFNYYQLFMNTIADFDTTGGISFTINDQDRISQIITGLQINTEYFFKLFVVDQAYNTSAASNEVSAFTSDQASAWNQTDWVQVGRGPQGIALTPDDQYLYVANIGENQVSVIETETNTIESEIAVGIDPVNVLPAPSGQYVYVSNWGSDNISILDHSSRTVVSTLEAGDGPSGMAISDNGNWLFVANSYSNTVYRYRTTDHQLISEYDVGERPQQIFLHPDADRLFVSNENSNTLSVISIAMGGIIETIEGFEKPYGIAYCSADERVFVANASEDVDYLSLVDDNGEYEISSNLQVGWRPFNLAIDDPGCLLYTTIFDADSDFITVLDLDTGVIVANVTVGYRPYDVKVSSDGSKIYVSNFWSNSISVIDYTP